jgi:hypothetical protein
MPDPILTMRTPRQPGESSSGLERIHKVVEQQQALHDANPAAYVPPPSSNKTQWRVDDTGKIRLSYIDPMSGTQKLFVAGLLGAATMGVGSALGPGAMAGANALSGAASSTIQGGGLKGALVGAGMGAATGGLAPGGSGAATAAKAGGGMDWTSLLKSVATNPDTYAALASVAGNAAAGKSDQRVQDTANTNAFNNSDTARYQTEQAAQNQAGQLDLQRKMFSEDARPGRAKQAMLADLLSNLQDINISVPGIQNANITGGLRASTMGATGKAGAAELGKQALAALMAGDTFTGGEVLKPNAMAPMPKAGGTEKALDWIGLLGAGAGALGKVQQAQEPTTYSQLPNRPPQPTGLGAQSYQQLFR